MSIEITRHFATVKGERQVHYRRAGMGPPVILLHQSPTSSREYIPLIREIAAKGFTVFSPDTPGNGMSDPFPGDEWKPMEGFADGVVNLMDELGIKTAPVYGFHTGGVCALALCLRHPDRFTVAIMDGYIQMEKADVDDILVHYLPELIPDWCGSHLTWAWARFREQLIFFPWYRKGAKNRMAVDLPGAAHLHTAVMDFMRCQDYRRAYRPAFLFDCANAVRNMKGNMVITTSQTDVLSAYHALMPTPPANVRAFNPPTVAEAKAQFIRIIAENPAPQAAPPIARTKPMPGRLWQEYVQVDGGSVYTRRNTDGAGRPIVFIHASAGSSLAMDRFMTPFIGKRPVIAVDLPGNGESDNSIGSDISVEAQARVLAGALQGLGITEADVFGYWGGCSVGVELAANHPGLVKHLAVPTLMTLDAAKREELLANYTPTIELDEFGAHWVRAWNMLRDQELFEPWYKHTKANATKHEPDIAPAVLHRRTVDLFKCLDIYQSAYAAHFRYPAAERLARVECPVLRQTKAGPGDFAGLAAELLAFFG